MMTTDIERQFFDTFEIEPHNVYPPQDELFGTREEMIEFFEEEYPQITDRILLELICILSKYQKDRGSLLEINEISLDEIKEEILEMLIYRVDGCKYQVQALFKGVNYAIKS